MPRFVRPIIAPSRLALGAVLATLLGALPAAAQGVGSNGVAGGGFHPIEGVGPKQTPHEQPPPGLPGTQPRDTAAPPEPELDVPPTEALFDAINRGDMPTARDALNRGADLNGRNVLGMTPLELSVDLSRNDITFLLMSMRSEASVSGQPPAPTGTLPPGARPARKGAAQASATKRLTPRMAAVPRPELADASSRSPSVRYASVPATPVPQAGFLGFGTPASP